MKLIIKRTKYNYDRKRPKVKKTIQLISCTILSRGAPRLDWLKNLQDKSIAFRKKSLSEERLSI